MSSDDLLPWDQSTSKALAAIGLLGELSNSHIDAQIDVFQPQQLRNPEKPVLLNAAVHGRLTPNLRNIWTLLEGIVVFDEIAYDGFAFDNSELRPEQRRRIEALRAHGLVPHVWPLEVYRATRKRLEQLPARKDIDAALAKVADHSASPDPFWDPYAVDYHIALHQSERAEYSFASSDRSLERAFFYAELQSRLKIGLLARAHDGKPMIDAIGRFYASVAKRRCPHELMKKTLTPFDEAFRPLEYRIAYPPLAQKILIRALRERRAPVDVAIELRQTPDAIAYRRHLAELQQEIRSAPEGFLGTAALQQLQSDFAQTVEKWVSAGSAGENVQYRSRTFSIKLLPGLAALTGFLATSEAEFAAWIAVAAASIDAPKKLTVPLPILWGGDRYLSFIADWYDRRS